MPFLFILLVILMSCGKESTYSILNSTWQEIAGRNDSGTLERPFVYRARIPSNWIRKDPPISESIEATTKAICEFYIEEENDKIRITIHNFPFQEFKMRIPPRAQVQRWEGQFDELDPTFTILNTSAHGGFTGLFLEAQGSLKGQPTKILGWSMQLAPEYASRLKIENSLDKQISSDYTIKALGPPELINKHKKSISNFADSFELIQELQSPL
jgi:hypothetical protein